MNTFQNPMKFNTADPVMLYHEGKYYCYGTNAGDGYWVHSSTDLEHWEREAKVFEKYDGFFGVDRFWAPEVYYHNGKFVMAFSCRAANLHHSIYIATSDSPTGPFKDVNGGKPFFAPEFSVIDANLLFDDDGRVYMYYSRDCSENIVDGIHESHLYVVEIEPDFSGVITKEPVLCTKPDHDWEKLSGNTHRWNEGPCAFKRNGIYYLMYTANFYASIHYAVGYATATSPFGPFTKSPANPILMSDGDLTMGTGHNNIMFSPDGKEMLCIYHSLKNRRNNDDGRVPNIDRMVFDDEGNLSIEGPTVTPQPLPSGTNE